MQGLTGLDVINEGACGFGGLVVEELPVHHDNGSVIAGRVAFEAFKGDGSGLVGFVGSDTNFFADGLPDFVAAHNSAQGIGAHAHKVLAGGVTLVLGVEGRNCRNFCTGDAQKFSAQCNSVCAHVAVFRLD